MDYSSTYSQQQKAYKTAILWIKYALDHDHIINTLKRSREKFELLSENNPDIDTYDQMISALTVLISNYEYKGWSIERIRDYLKKLKSHYSTKLKNMNNDDYRTSFGKLTYNPKLTPEENFKRLRNG